MEKLNRDELFSLAINLDLPSLLKFCRTNKHFLEQICARDEIWNYRLMKEFPDYRLLNLKNETSKKEIYQLLHSLVQLRNELKRKESIYKLYNLQKLDLSNKKLTKIPENLGNLVNLRTLDLSNNNLTKIPTSLGNLVNLQTLYLYGNSLTEIPASLSNLSHLQTLYLSGNNLTEKEKIAIKQKYGKKAKLYI